MVRPGSFIFKLLPAPCAMSRRVFRGARAVAGLPRDACARNPTRPHPTIVVTVLVTVVENKVREAFAPPPTAYVPSPAPYAPLPAPASPHHDPDRRPERQPERPNAPPPAPRPMMASQIAQAPTGPIVAAPPPSATPAPAAALGQH